MSTHDSSSTTGGGIDPASVHGLMQQLAVPLVLYHRASGRAHANDKFNDIFPAGPPDRRALERVAAGSPSVSLRCCDGLDRVVDVHTMTFGDAVLMIFDDVPRRLLLQENATLRERVEAAESLSATDSMTGAWNRAQLDRMIGAEIGRAQRFRQPLTLVLVDLDHFKQVNDEHGHLVGDAVLKEFVHRIRHRIREGDALFRWGGDEFVVLAPSVGYRGGAALAEGLRRAVAGAPFARAGQLTASLGVTEYVKGESEDAWFQRTDRALYAAKSAGRNRLHVDRQGDSDLDRGAGVRTPRLYWLDAYRCGDSGIDADHRELFDLGNALIAEALQRPGDRAFWARSIDALIARLVEHFETEEAILAKRRRDRLAAHRGLHAALVRRATQLKESIGRGEGDVSHLVSFLVNDVIALHFLKADRELFMPPASDLADAGFRVGPAPERRAFGGPLH